MTTPNVPGYIDLEKIGSGGFAVVYRATQQAVGRQVALKLLHSAVIDEDTERRFERECRVVGSLSWHPHIAAVLDAGVDDEGRSYLAFELLGGGSLGDRLDRDGPLPWQDALTVAIQTADALEAAHAQDVLHRDVKPDNILMDRLGRAKLADFGIAQMRDGNQTKSGVITATLVHAAPEVLSGQRATKLTDVYLLGSTLFELIAGEPPFGKAVGNDFFATIQRIATEPAPFLASHGTAGTCPVELAEVVDAALRKDPVERPASAAAFGDLMRGVQRAMSLAPTEMPFVDAGEIAPPTEGRTGTEPVAPPEPSPPSEHTTVVPARSNKVDDATTALPQTGAIAAPPSVTTVASSRSRSKTPLVVAALVLAGAAAAFVSLRASRGSEEPLGITAIEAFETESQQGLIADNVIDDNLATGWLSPVSPNGHQIVIGFGQPVNLVGIVIHAGPGRASTGPLSQARGLGTSVLEFSDGTELALDLDESQSMHTVPIGRQTTSLAIRSAAEGSQAVAIREVMFIGQPVAG